ncbi:hypothetical protein JX266_009255 [Neoarthrinium moseri]|nr:hypothetical protein JX266_009255 [Neoarthrinium moseri]
MTTDDGDEPRSASTSTPSFNGRLKLHEFMYSKPEGGSTSVRRSPRLAIPLSTTASPSSSPSKTPSASPARATKRKQGPQSEVYTEEASSQLSATTRGTRNSSSTTPSPKKKRNRVKTGYAPPSTYAHLPHLVDVLAPDLLILFVGLNPGLQTARSGHAYAHPSNLFWKLLYSSGITPVPCRAEEDRTLPARFALGNTNIVARPSRNGAELSKAEMDEGVAVLEAKIRTWRPEVVCVVGKSIWESVWRVRKGKAISKAEFSYGWQHERENMGVVRAHEGEGKDGTRFAGARVFVATSTSGLAASLRPEEKARIWKELGDWCVKRREERKAALD